jgi:acyl-homoserine lactone acylase PvdQ
MGSLAARRKGAFPFAGRLLGLERLPWTPADVILACRTVGWFGLVSMTQMARLAVTRLIAEDVDAEALRLLLGPGAEGLDLATCRGLFLDTGEAALGLPIVQWSSAFAVSARRSASGRPLLMAELHLEVGRFPPVAYVSHVQHADGGYLQGAKAHIVNVIEGAGISRKVAKLTPMGVIKG